ncbi:hypothetical protein EFA46_009965 [Halarchaeum sp. CBA1220]|uniref:DUF5805 domain-containing protein n=1 Tax=Halarchaeum sp. CBA1220 TaxID=1853682 RepID=UPI000F3A91FA|nr:DUF5805 domain-containing protein [Halarchaeum sp. CBA1220]QLC34514.1 hypothetical protein EFA46_009965 [Halarchaeum sp. CBA1220]
MSSEDDAERTSVKTYVPRYQKESWKERADELGMTQSEFVRTMVQAGVRDLGLDGAGASGSDGGDDVGEDDGGAGLDARVVAELRERGVADWETLLTALTGDFEERLEETLAALDDEGTIRYSPRDGGYVLREADE